jgi:hypothetical protein
MHSMPTPVEADDPHDAPVIAPDIIAAARADKVFADTMSDAKSDASDQKPGTESRGARARAIDTTFRAAAVGSVQTPREKPRAPKWATSAIMAFLFALCSGIAATAWQHYGDAAKQMVSNWTPQFALASSPSPEPAAPAAQPDASAVQASATDRAPPQAMASAQPQESAASDTAALTPESSPLIQSMARDLAAMGQQIEQLKASIADLKASQQAMARDVVRTPEAKTPEARISEVRPSGVRTALQNTRPKVSLPPPPLRLATAPVRRPIPAYPPVQAAAVQPLPLAISRPAAPPQPAPPRPAAVDDPEDGPVVRPPMPLR